MCVVQSSVGASAAVCSLEAKAGNRQAQGFVLKTPIWRELDWSPATPLEHYSEDLCKMLQTLCPYWQVVLASHDSEKILKFLIYFKP